MELVNHSSTDPSKRENSSKEKIKRVLLLFAGTLTLILGIIGIVIPILPTTPFLLLSAACFTRSSKKFYNWLMNNKILGFYVRNYREGRGMPLKLKIFTVSLLWFTILLSVFFFISILWVRILLIIIAITVSTHIMLIRPKKKDSNS